MSLVIPQKQSTFNYTDSSGTQHTVLLYAGPTVDGTASFVGALQKPAGMDDTNYAVAFSAYQYTDTTIVSLYTDLASFNNWIQALKAAFNTWLASLVSAAQPTQPAFTPPATADALSSFILTNAAFVANPNGAGYTLGAATQPTSN